jgi:hypothetical protein
MVTQITPTLSRGQRLASYKYIPNAPKREKYYMQRMVLFSLYVMKQQTMKTYGTSALHESERPASRFGRFISRKEIQGCWMGPKADPDAGERREISYPCREQTPC